MNDDVEPPGPRRSALEPAELVVAPTRIGSGRRSRQPGVIAAIVVIAFVGVSVWKPWDGGSSGRSPSPRTFAPIASEPDGVAGASDGRLPGGPLPNPNPFAPFPSKATLLQATNRDPTWGIRAVVVRDGPPAYTGEPAVVERWLAADDAVATTPPAPSPAPSAVSSLPLQPLGLTISQPTDEVAAIGLTTAADALALDVRIWRLTDSTSPERLAPFGIVGPEAGSWLWLPDPSHVTAAGMWPAGTYEIDALLGPRIVRLFATIPDSAPEVVRSTAPLTDQPLGVALSRLELGLVALADGGAENLLGGQPPAADERTAWLGVAAGLPPPTRVESNDVTGFGWIAAPGERVVSIEVQTMTANASAVPVSSDLLGIGSDGRSAIVARPVFIPNLPTGLYRVTTSLIGPSGPRTEVATIEIVPLGLQSPPLAPLDAMVRWVGLLDHPDQDVPHPLVFITDAAGSSGECDAATAITGSDALFGIVLPPGVTLGRLRMLPENVTQSADIAIRYAPNAIPRLTVVALPSEGLPIRDYDVFLTLESAAGETRIAERICVSPA